MADTILLALDDHLTAQLLRNVLSASGFQAIEVENRALLVKTIIEQSPALVILDAAFDGVEWDALVYRIHTQLPTLPVILYTAEVSQEVLQRAITAGLAGVIAPPMRPDDVLHTVQGALKQARQLGDWLRREIRRTTASLQRHSEALQTLLELGRDITRLLDLDTVLEKIVSAAVKLVHAEEGTLMVLDEGTGELYVRASKNFDQEFVERLRLPVQDSLAGQVVRSGRPVVINSEKVQKIKTTYLVHALLYVPLRGSEGKVFGVLGVDNRTVAREFSDEQLMLISILADYASVALQNASLYALVRQERNKLDAIFQNIENGVLILDTEGRIVLMNPAARFAFNIARDADIEGRPLAEVVDNEDLQSLLKRENIDELTYHEVHTTDGNVYNAQGTVIPGVGIAITLNDITYLKDLDRMKTDFIHTVSHDLRSPLTAVLGYAELLERVGELTERQQEFVRRIKQGVQSITDLVNDLLDLGKIESGFDSRQELVQLKGVLSYVLDGLRVQLDQKKQTLQLEISDEIPPFKGNPIRLRQVMDNLIGNAIKYTQPGGEIVVRLFPAEGQIVFEVSDNGPGIPLEDQPHIFEKFYRGDNTNESGSGLGLAIVKSIVDSYNGRIWVDSSPGKGTTFTVVLPVGDETNRPDSSAD